MAQRTSLKFKTGFGLLPRTTWTSSLSDLGFIAVVENGQVVGYNVTVGGGMVNEPWQCRNLPVLADLLGFIPAGNSVPWERLSWLRNETMAIARIAGMRGLATQSKIADGLVLSPRSNDCRV